MFELIITFSVSRDRIKILEVVMAIGTTFRFLMYSLVTCFYPLVTNHYTLIF